MSSCEQYLPDLCAWLDGELEDSRALEAHLAGCASCQAQAAAYRRLDAQIAKVEPPRNLHSHIMAGIDAAMTKPPKKKLLSGPWKGVAATAAALLIVVGAGLLTLPYWGGMGQTMDMAAPAAAPEANAVAMAPDLTAATTAKTTETDNGGGAPAIPEDAVVYPVELPMEEAVMDSAEPSVESPEIPMDVPASEPAEAPMVDGYESQSPADEALTVQVTTSGGDMGLYDGAESESYIVYGGTLDTETKEQLQLAIAAGQELVWTIYNGEGKDTLDEMAKYNDFVQVRDEALWIMTLESDQVLELYQLLATDLGGDLTISENSTGSIVLDLR